MTDTEIRQKLLDLFHLERQRPNNQFDENHFLDYLIDPPSKPNSIKNTFRGVRKYYRFMNRVELEFGICFRLADQDKCYTVDKLVQKVKERLSKKSGNIMILKQRISERNNYLFEFSVIIVLLGFFFFLGVNWFTFILLFIAATILFWTVSARIHDTQHNKRLYRKIVEETN